ncbi:amine oxidase, partial [Auricularia subglabra TFB-10046 SS5]
DSGITYEILEADPERVGGRLYTHHFKGDKPNDYYDVGAMRFSHGVPFMDRVFDLLAMLGIETMDYVMSLPQNLNFFNGVLLTNKELEAAGPDPFRTGVGVGQSVKELVKQQIGGFKDALVHDFPAGWEKLMKYDNHSTRSYMVFQGTGTRYTPEVVDFLETFDSATNIYDQALTETVMRSLDFDYPDEKHEKIHWKCIHGGSQQIADKLAAALQPGTVQLGQRVTAIKPGANAISVTVANTDVRTYDHVITTVPFSCLQAMDTSSCDFPWELQSAMRMLHYDASTKVAIQFRTRWWEVEYNQLGGVSKTDRPTRVIVYPSYGIGEETGATMIVSYTWSQDALRTGAFLDGKPDAKDHLIDLILKDLSDMHGVPFTTLKELMVDSHAYGWYNHEHSGGAFALFGPGQFASLYPHVTSPSCNGMLHFAGEATSVHHAWVVGALNSAYRTVSTIV